MPFLRSSSLDPPPRQRDARWCGTPGWRAVALSLRASWQLQAHIEEQKRAIDEV